MIQVLLHGVCLLREEDLASNPALSLDHELGGVCNL